MDINKQIPNYHLLLDCSNFSIENSRGCQMSLAVCYLRINLPKIKSKYSADEMTQKCINRLKKSIRDIDTLASVTVSDYVILLENINETICHEIMKRLISAILDSNGEELSLSVNIGVCIFPSGAYLQEELVMLAKTQLLEAIKKGENQYSIYNNNLKITDYRKVMIEKDLPNSIKNGQLYLNYQPQLNLEELKIIGVEALIRWKHPILGEVSPAEFIPLAESTGFVGSIFYWSLEEIFKNSHQFAGDVKVSINVTVEELLQKNFIDTVLARTEKHGVQPNFITLEITENQKISDVELLSEIILELKKHGFSIALDDFGNGYFSFLDFIKLPVDIIKLDKQFVFSLSIEEENLNQSIKNIVDMAHHLSYKVVIEGIENLEQYLKWKELNCEMIQGYYISKPLPLEELNEAMKLIPQRIKQDLHSLTQ